MSTERRAQEPRRVDEPEPGFYRAKLVRRGPWVAAHVSQDDDGLWVVVVNGDERERSFDPWSIAWLRDRYHYADRITQDEHAYLIATARWAEVNDPNHPAANPRQPIRATTIPPLF